MSHPAEYLVHLYEGLGSLGDDFCNFNPLRLIAGNVSGDRVLEIGCGRGGLLSLLRKQGDSVCGFEPNAGLVELANRPRPERHVVQGAGVDWGRVAGAFDTITIIDLLEHIEDDRGQGISKFQETGFESCRQRDWNVLGSLPYFVSERLLHRELNSERRTNRPQNWWRRMMIRLLHGWFREVKNRVRFGFGLSFLWIAGRPKIVPDVLPQTEELHRAA